jgi:predicted helicase
MRLISNKINRYILDLLLSALTVSMKTADIVVGKLPKVEWK